jgi:hypothetical protein
VRRFCAARSALAQRRPNNGIEISPSRDLRYRFKTNGILKVRAAIPDFESVNPSSPLELYGKPVYINSTVVIYRYSPWNTLSGY